MEHEDSMGNKGVIGPGGWCFFFLKQRNINQGRKGHSMGSTGVIGPGGQSFSWLLFFF